jgi:uncharacterized protein (TIGR02271 family)
MSLLHLEGAYENELATTGEFNPQAPKTALMLPSGQRVVLPTEVLLEALTAGRVSKEAKLEVENGNVAPHPEARANVSGEEAVIPLTEEQLQVSKTTVETGRVRYRRQTEEHLETVSVPLADVRWEVEHVPVGQVVEAQPEIRQVGDTIVFPLVEERLVVKRELWLREEVHVHKVKSVVEKSAEFPVKRDVLVEERSETGTR